MQGLTDNEKMAWLESLFYLDTSNNSRRNLSHVTPAQQQQSATNSLKINKAKRESPERDAHTLKPSQMIKEQQQQQKPKPQQPKPKETDADAAVAAAAAQGVNLNANLVGLAQSFFSEAPKPKQQQQRKTSAPVTTRPNFHLDIPNPLTKDGSSKSLSTSPRQRSPGVQNAVPTPFAASPTKPSNPFTVPVAIAKTNRKVSTSSLSSSPSSPPSSSAAVPERAFFEPSSPGEGVKEDSPEFPPPIPNRSDKSKTALLRLMKNTTSIMKN